MCYRFKKNQIELLELKTMTSEMKNTLNEVNGVLDVAQEIISKVEGGAIGATKGNPTRKRLNWCSHCGKHLSPYLTSEEKQTKTQQKEAVIFIYLSFCNVNPFPSRMVWPLTEVLF